jgi:hypothetical protein
MTSDTESGEVCYVVKSTRRGTWQRDEVNVDKTYSTPQAYHPDRECPRLNRVEDERIREVAVDHADRRNLDLCDFCAGEHTEYKQTEPFECPFCGAEVPSLPSHLPDCDST